MNLLLSIKPEYSDKIFSGEKKFEFRRQKPKRRFEIVLVYESHPSKKIVGWFSVKKIISGSPADVWERCGKSGGIEEDDYFEYCGDKDIIYAFQIDKIFHFQKPINPSKMNPEFSPPQSFSYLNQSLASSLMLGFNGARKSNEEFPNLLNFS